MKLIFLSILLLVFSSLHAQDSTSYIRFLELVDKVQKDPALKGTFMYKGYKVNIGESTDFKSIIGKFMEIRWNFLNLVSDETPQYKALYHTKFGYMTRNIFSLFKKEYGKEYKIANEKYCKNLWCIELLENYKLPIMLQFMQKDNEIKEIK